VVDENGNTVARNTRGELWARGYSILLEYFDNADLFKAKVTPHGWYKTGYVLTLAMINNLLEWVTSFSFQTLNIQPYPA